MMERNASEVGKKLMDWNNGKEEPKSMMRVKTVRFSQYLREGEMEGENSSQKEELGNSHLYGF